VSSNFFRERSERSESCCDLISFRARSHSRTIERLERGGACTRKVPWRTGPSLRRLLSMDIAIGRGFPSCEQRTMPHPAINKTCPRLLRPRERSAAAFGRETFEIRTTYDFHPGWDIQFIKRRPCAGISIWNRRASDNKMSVYEDIWRVRIRARAASFTFYGIYMGLIVRRNTGEKWISCFSLAPGSHAASSRVLESIDSRAWARSRPPSVDRELRIVFAIA
jgi:hypothetical protein